MQLEAVYLEALLYYPISVAGIIDPAWIMIADSVQNNLLMFLLVRLFLGLCMHLIWQNPWAKEFVREIHLSENSTSKIR